MHKDLEWLHVADPEATTLLLMYKDRTGLIPVIRVMGEIMLMKPYEQTPAEYYIFMPTECCAVAHYPNLNEAKLALQERAEKDLEGK